MARSLDKVRGNENNEMYCIITIGMDSFFCMILLDVLVVPKDIRSIYHLRNEAPLIGDFKSVQYCHRVSSFSCDTNHSDGMLLDPPDAGITTS